MTSQQQAEVMDRLRFKIDISGSSAFPFGLFVERPGLFRSRWAEIDRFQTRERAKELYEQIKDLPEYLT